MQRFRDILVFVNADSTDDPAVARAADLARRTGAKLTLADALEPVSGWLQRRLRSIVAQPSKRIREDRLRKLDAMARPLVDDGIPVTTRVLDGHAPDAVLHAVQTYGYDLVMKTARGNPQTGVGTALDFDAYGDVAVRLMRSAPVPVWVVGREHAGAYRRVLAAVDPTPEDDTRRALSQRVLDLSSALALDNEAELHVVHAWSSIGARLMMSRGDSDDARWAARQARGRAQRAVARELRDLGREGLEPHLHLQRGQPEHVVPQVHGELGADLLVIGTVGRSGLSGWVFGNTAEKVLRVMTGSLLAVKPLAAEAVRTEPVAEAI